MAFAVSCRLACFLPVESRWFDKEVWAGGKGDATRNSVAVIAGKKLSTSAGPLCFPLFVSLPRRISRIETVPILWRSTLTKAEGRVKPYAWMAPISKTRARWWPGLERISLFVGRQRIILSRGTGGSLPMWNPHRGGKRFSSKMEDPPLVSSPSPLSLAHKSTT